MGEELFLSVACPFWVLKDTGALATGASDLHIRPSVSGQCATEHLNHTGERMERERLAGHWGLFYFPPSCVATILFHASVFLRS